MIPHNLQKSQRDRHVVGASLNSLHDLNRVMKTGSQYPRRGTGNVTDGRHLLHQADPVSYLVRGSVHIRNDVVSPDRARQQCLVGCSPADSIANLHDMG